MDIMETMADDVIWEALSRALAGKYDILTRLGFGRGDAPIYLARELATDTLVGLRMPPLTFGDDAQEFGLEVVRQLDSSLPDIETRCSHCGATLRQWSRFCSRCGRDVSGIAPSATGQTRETLRALARDVAADKYDVLGEMSRAEGGGLVYFGRELATGKIVGLQLEPGPEAGVTMTETQFEALGETLKIERPRETSPADTARRQSIPRGVEHQPPAPTPPAPAPAMKREVRMGIVALLVIATGILLYQVL
jgi:hypothetical protein